MFNKIRKKIYNQRIKILLDNGLQTGKIKPFDEDFYKVLSKTYFNNIPISIHIKYLKPSNVGGCLERSLYIFYCFCNAILVRANLINLELEYGKDYSIHGWVEIGKYVYDPSLLMRFDRELYYEIFKPKNVYKINGEEYCSVDYNRKEYDDIVNTTLEDFMPGGKKRLELLNTMPLIIEIANNSGNYEFMEELSDFISTVQYDEDEIKKIIDKELIKLKK